MGAQMRKTSTTRFPPYVRNGRYPQVAITVTPLQANLLDSTAVRQPVDCVSSYPFKDPLPLTVGDVCYDNVEFLRLRVCVWLPSAAAGDLRSGPSENVLRNIWHFLPLSGFVRRLRTEQGRTLWMNLTSASKRGPANRADRVARVRKSLFLTFVTLHTGVFFRIIVALNIRGHTQR